MSIAGAYSIQSTVQPAVVSNVECNGILDTVPSTVKTFKVSMTTFKNNPTYYTDQAKKGYIVIISGYNGANYQLIKI